jgi:hypothetical protein
MSDLDMLSTMLSERGVTGSGVWEEEKRVSDSPPITEQDHTTRERKKDAKGC